MIKIGFNNSRDYGLSIDVVIKDQVYILCFCHHLPERSIKFLGIEKYLCARCFGILFGGLFGILLILLSQNVPLILILFLMMPLIIDGFLQIISDYSSNNKKRFITGSCFGVAILYFSFYFSRFFFAL